MKAVHGKIKNRRHLLNFHSNEIYMAYKPQTVLNYYFINALLNMSFSLSRVSMIFLSWSTAWEVHTKLYIY